MHPKNLEGHYTFENILQGIMFPSSTLLDKRGSPRERGSGLHFGYYSSSDTHEGVSIVVEFLTRCNKISNPAFPAELPPCEALWVTFVQVLHKHTKINLPGFTRV